MKIGPYEVLRSIGRGGAGAVFEAKGPDGQIVAVKLLTSRATPEVLARFARERRLLDEGTEGFVPLLGEGVGPTGPYLVMPLLRGGTLRDRLKGTPMPVDDVLFLGEALARAVGNAHARGIVHRDLKPENVLFDEHGTPLVADLGIAKHFRHDDGNQSVSVSADGSFLGTAGYAAPEQFVDARRVGPPADVFSLGAILYECLSGEEAFPGDSTVEILRLVTSGHRPPVRERCARFAPPWLVGVVERTLAQDPRSRFPDGLALADALASAAAQPTRRFRPALGVALVLLAAAVVGLAVGRRADGGRATPTPGPPSSPPSPPPGATPPGPPAANRGWADEALPKGLVRGAERPLYVWDPGKGVPLELVRVPAGPFLAGEPPTPATIERAFWIGRTEITWRQFRAFEAANPVAGIHLESPSWGELPDAPAVHVSWYAARSFCQWLDLELPTALQWERAARGTDGRLYPWGSEPPTPERCVFLGHPVFGRAQPDRSVDADGRPMRPRGASPVGALDMAGNVWEWCLDATGLEGRDRLNRGGGFAATPERCRASISDPNLATGDTPDLGFRVVLPGS